MASSALSAAGGAVLTGATGCAAGVEIVGVMVGRTVEGAAGITGAAFSALEEPSSDSILIFFLILPRR
jgi:hypothetical protein